jgi:hypothetical protein
MDIFVGFDSFTSLKVQVQFINFRSLFKPQIHYMFEISYIAGMFCNRVKKNVWLSTHTAIEISSGNSPISTCVWEAHTSYFILKELPSPF